MLSPVVNSLTLGSNEGGDPNPLRRTRTLLSVNPALRRRSARVGMQLDTPFLSERNIARRGDALPEI